MTQRKPIKKWIVKEVPLIRFGEVIPLRIDIEDGAFWFEYPADSGNQYAGWDQKTMREGISTVAHAFHHATWTPHIAIREMAPPFGYEGTPPIVGFDRLFRFEKSVIELRVPNTRGERSQGGIVNTIHCAKKNPEDEWRWTTIRSTSRRLYPGDTEYLYTGGKKQVDTYGCTVLDYSDDLWVRFMAIHDVCVGTRLRLKALLKGTPDEIQTRLEALEPGLPLLGDG